MVQSQSGNLAMNWTLIVEIKFILLNSIIGLYCMLGHGNCNFITKDPLWKLCSQWTKAGKGECDYYLLNHLPMHWLKIKIKKPWGEHCIGQATTRRKWLIDGSWSQRKVILKSKKRKANYQAQTWFLLNLLILIFF